MNPPSPPKRNPRGISTKFNKLVHRFAHKPQLSLPPPLPHVPTLDISGTDKYSTDQTPRGAQEIDYEQEAKKIIMIMTKKNGSS